jgi:hypothetical protein
MSEHLDDQHAGVVKVPPWVLMRSFARAALLLDQATDYLTRWNRLGDRYAHLIAAYRELRERSLDNSYPKRCTFLECDEIYKRRRLARKQHLERIERRIEKYKAELDFRAKRLEERESRWCSAILTLRDLSEWWPGCFPRGWPPAVLDDCNALCSAFWSLYREAADRVPSIAGKLDAHVEHGNTVAWNKILWAFRRHSFNARHYDAMREAAMRLRSQIGEWGDAGVIPFASAETPPAVSDSTPVPVAAATRDRSMSLDDRAVTLWFNLTKRGERPSIRRLAQELRCNRRHLYRCPNLRALFEQERKGNPPRGYRTHAGTIEAWDESRRMCTVARSGRARHFCIRQIFLVLGA